MCIYTYIYICIYTHIPIWFQMSFKRCHIYIYIHSKWLERWSWGLAFLRATLYAVTGLFPGTTTGCGSQRAFQGAGFLGFPALTQLRKWTTFRPLKVGVPIFLEGNGESSEPSNLQRRFLLVFRRSHLKDHQKRFTLQKEWPYFWHQKSCAFHIDIVVRLARFFGAFLLAGTDAKPPARPFRDSNFKWKAEEPLKKLMDFCPPCTTTPIKTPESFWTQK